jgi:hypothetical protein
MGRRDQSRPRNSACGFGVAAFGRKPPSKIPAQFAALCRDAATPAPFPLHIRIGNRRVPKRQRAGALPAFASGFGAVASKRSGDGQDASRSPGRSEFPPSLGLLPSLHFSATRRHPPPLFPSVFICVSSVAGFFVVHPKAALAWLFPFGLALADCGRARHSVCAGLSRSQFISPRPLFDDG